MNIKKWAVIVFSVYTIASFVCFICEEAMQTAMFGAFSYTATKGYTESNCEALESHLKLMEQVHRSSEVMINTIGMIAFVSYPAYRIYLKSNDGYIKSVKYKLEENCRP